MSRAETDRKFDEIVDFADLGKFLDTAVGLLQLGHAARLGFAVAINVDADIFIADEALAVGDRPFKRKCRSSMDEIVKSGMTMFYVCHAPGSVRNLCDRVLVLEKGGSPSTATSTRASRSCTTTTRTRTRKSRERRRRPRRGHLSPVRRRRVGRRAATGGTTSWSAPACRRPPVAVAPAADGLARHADEPPARCPSACGGLWPPPLRELRQSGLAAYDGVLVGRCSRVVCRARASAGTGPSHRCRTRIQTCRRAPRIRCAAAEVDKSGCVGVSTGNYTIVVTHET